MPTYILLSVRRKVILEGGKREFFCTAECFVYTVVRIYYTCSSYENEEKNV